MANNFNPDSNDIDRLHAAVKREKADLPAGAEPAPMWAIFIGFIVAIIGGGQLGGTNTTSLLESTPNYGVVADPRGGGVVEDNLDPFQKAMKNGGQLYASCQGCHQASGMGAAGQFPPLAGSEFVKGGTERLVRIPIRGITGPLSVKGQSWNVPNGMLPWGGGAPLSTQGLADVLTYIRNSWGNEGPMVTKAMVEAVMDQIKDHPAQWTDAELAPLADKNCKGDIPAGPGATAAPAAAGAPPAPVTK